LITPTVAARVPLALEGDDVVGVLPHVVRQLCVTRARSPSDHALTERLPVADNRLVGVRPRLSVQDDLIGVGVDKEDADIIVGEVVLDQGSGLLEQDVEVEVSQGA
jgi:hypothetical protein